MGDPKFPRRKWEGPRHPWEADRIAAENELLKKYGLKNKRELWRAESLLRRFRQRSRILQAQSRYGSVQAEREAKELLGRLERIALLAPDGTLNDILGLDVEAILSRRFQTMTYVKGLAHTPRHARQLVVHGHMAIGGRKVTIPGYIVTRDEEDDITYTPSSPLAHDLHPARPSVERVLPPLVAKPSEEE